MDILSLSLSLFLSPWGKRKKIPVRMFGIVFLLLLLLASFLAVSLSLSPLTSATPAEEGILISSPILNMKKKGGGKDT